MRNKKNVKILQMIFLFAILILSSIPLYAQTAKKTLSVVPVSAIVVKNTSVEPIVQAPGTVIAQQGTVVRAVVPGQVTAIYFKSGQYVAANAPLVQIYPDILQAKLASAEATFNLDKSTYQRFAKLVNQKIVSKQEYDTAVANYNKAVAVVAEAKARLDQTLIKAPFAGVLGIRQANIGNYLNTGQAIVNLQNTDAIFVDFFVPEQDLERVKVGQVVDLTSNAYPKRTFVGHVLAYEALINPKNLMLTVRAIVPNQGHILIPGSLVIVKLLPSQQSNILTIPKTALMHSKQGHYVYKIVAHKAEKTAVSLGEHIADNVTIKTGLRVGDKVIVSGQQKLHVGARVKAVG